MVVTSTKKFITIFQHFSRVFDRKAKTNFERGVFLLSLVSTELCYAVITVLTAGGRPQSTEINTWQFPHDNKPEPRHRSRPTGSTNEAELHQWTMSLWVSLMQYVAVQTFMSLFYCVLITFCSPIRYHYCEPFPLTLRHTKGFASRAVGGSHCEAATCLSLIPLLYQN